VGLGVDFTSLTASDVGRHYGRRKALAQISFECRAGEVVGLLGPNGAGKSTLLAILATLLTPSTGRVTYGGRTADEAGAAIRGCIGLLGHDLFLYPELTARENLLFFARLYDLLNAPAVVEASLTHANLVDRADDRVGSFSRGMRQRLALERSLLHAPRLLLLDEPFTGLDQASAAALVTRLKDVQARGSLVMVATHDLDVAEGLLTRALYLRNGRIVREDAGGQQLRERYQAAMSAS
jgi:heme exporter protein A